MTRLPGKPKPALLLALALLPMLAQAAIHTRIDREELLPGESLTLTIEATDDEDLDSIDLAPLDDDFIVAGQTSSTRYSSINGKSEFRKELRITLFPRDSGRLLVPALPVDGDWTTPIAITVVDAPTGPGDKREVFVEAELDRDVTRVQGQLIYRFRLYQSVELEQARLAKPLEVPGAAVEQLEGQSFQRLVDGKRYRVSELQYAIFPQRSGTLEIPSLTMTARKRVNWGRSELLRRNTESLTAEVQPIPASYPDAPWLPLNQLKLEERWSRPLDELAVGDSVTRTLTLTAVGLGGNQLPALATPDIPGLKLYADPPAKETISDNQGITGISTYSTAILVTEPGSYRLPPVRVAWWDTGADELRWAELPAHEFTVAAPASVATPDPVPQAPPPVQGKAVPAVLEVSASAWMWATLAACSGWLLTTVWLWRRGSPGHAPRRGQRVAASSEPNRFKALCEACRAGDPLRSRRALQSWARTRFSSATRPSLEEIGRQIGDPEIAAALEALDRSLYADSGDDWNGPELAERLKRWRASAGTSRRESRATLPALN